MIYSKGFSGRGGEGAYDRAGRCRRCARTQQRRDPAVADGGGLTTGPVQPAAALIEVRKDLINLGLQGTGGDAAWQTQSRP
jgi:hypothetical protein